MYIYIYIYIYIGIITLSSRSQASLSLSLSFSLSLSLSSSLFPSSFPSLSSNPTILKSLCSQTPFGLVVISGELLSSQEMCARPRYAPNPGPRPILLLLPVPLTIANCNYFSVATT